MFTEKQTSKHTVLLLLTIFSALIHFASTPFLLLSDALWLRHDFFSLFEVLLSLRFFLDYRSSYHNFPQSSIHHQYYQYSGSSDDPNPDDHNNFDVQFCRRIQFGNHHP